ncbi:MAG: hypothetical protein ABII00_09415 [Elusimicrobiota bacterium]
MSVAEAVRWPLAALTLAAAVVVLYTDHKYKRIPNRMLLACLKVVGLAYAAYIGWTALASKGLLPAPFLRAYPAWSFYPAILVHMAAAVAAGVLIWRLGLWPAGDAKLFLLLCLWLPIVDPGSALLPGRLALAFLMNIFIPAALFVVARTMWWVWRFKLRHGAGFLRELGLFRLLPYLIKSQAELRAEVSRRLAESWTGLRRDPRASAYGLAGRMGFTVVGAAAATWLDGARAFVGMPEPALFIGVFLVWDLLRRAAGERVAWGLCLAALAAAAYQAAPGDWPRFWGNWWEWLFFMAAMDAGKAMVRVFLGVRERFLALLWIGSLILSIIGPGAVLARLGYAGASGLLGWALWGTLCGLAYFLVSSFLEQDVVYLPLKKVHPYLVPAEETIGALRQDPEYFRDHFDRLYPDGLTPEQTGAFKHWCRSRALQVVAFKKTRPFAFWIFLGAVLTVLLRRDVLTLALWGGRYG